MAEQSGSVEHFDVIVIGSGFGGAVSACRLAQAGFRVLVLERGRRYQPEDFPALPDDDRIAPDLRRWLWSKEQGLWDVQDLGEIISAQAAGYGGGSLLYANVHLRAAEKTFDDEAWPKKFREGALEPFYDLAAFMLDPSPIHESPLGEFTKTRILNSVACGLGRDVLRPPLAISHRSGPNEFGEEQRACTGCGRCCSGCPEGAKNTLDYNYLAVAERNGAVARTQCEVKHIAQGRLGEAARWRVEYVNHITADYVTVTAANLFLCAGAVNSVRLLRGARLRRDPHRVQERVGLGYFPNADALGMVYDTREECFPSSGPCITTGVVHWEPPTAAGASNRPRVVMIQDGGYAPELERLLGVLRAPIWNGRNRLHHADSVAPRGVHERAPTPLPGVALVSPLDAVLDALNDPRVTERMKPPALAKHWDGFLREVGGSLIMRHIVAATIERSARARHAKLPSWLKKLFDYDSLPVRAFVWIFRGLIRFAGGNAEVGHHALRGLLRGSDLNRNEYLQDIAGYDGRNATRRMMLLAMGEDAAPGALIFDKQRGLIADLDLYHLVPGYTNQELLMKDIARSLGGELRVNPAWAFFGKPVTVHSQGGCAMSENPTYGVTNEHGQVHGCEGLFVMDASVLCRSVGVNPTPTILAISEANLLHFIQAARGGSWPRGDDRPGAREYQEHVRKAEAWKQHAVERGWQLRPTPPRVPTKPVFESEPLGIRFREKFHGYLAPIDGTRDPLSGARERIPLRADAEHRRLEIEARPGHPFVLELTATCQDLNRFIEDVRHRLELEGHLEFTLPGHPLSGERLPVSGYLDLLVERHKPYGLSRGRLRHAQKCATGYEYLTLKGDPNPGEPRFMLYHLRSPDDTLRLSGYKRIRNDPGLDAWRDTTALFSRFGTPRMDGTGQKSPLGGAIDVLAAGVVHVNMTDFLFDEVPSFECVGGERARNAPALEVTGTTDPARITWAAAKFSSFFFGTLQRIYSPQTVNVLDAFFQPMPNGVRHQRPIRRV